MRPPCGRSSSGADGAELRRRPQLHGPGELVRPDVRDRRRQAAGEVLDAQRVGVAGGLERRALVPAGVGAGGDVPAAHVGVEPGQDLVEVGVDPRHGRPGQRAGEVAVLAVRRAALGEVDAPVGAGRDRLQLALRRRADDDREGRLGAGVGGALVGAPQAGDPVAAEELDVVDAGGRDPPQDLGRVRALGGRPGDDDVARRPEPGAGRSERSGHMLFNRKGRPFPLHGCGGRCGE